MIIASVMSVSVCETAENSHGGDGSAALRQPTSPLPHPAAQWKRVAEENAEKKPDVPLELGFNNIKTRTISGSLVGADTLGAGQNKRKVITIVDDYGNTRTGVFTSENVITEAAINSRKKTLAESLNVDVLKMQEGERVDSRNSALYDVAGMLGRSDLVAASMDVKLERSGRVTNGNFMEFVNGTDLNHLGPDDPYCQIDPDDYLSDSVKKDMLDLTIIDYLCLNIDRNSSNMIYQYAKDENNVTRLVGIKGIDNDSSFGAENPALDEHFNRIQPLTSTVIMTEAMASKIKALDPEKLELALSKYNMNEDAIKAARDRLIKLKDLLHFGEKVSNDLRELQSLRDKKDEGTLSKDEEKKLNAAEKRYKGFEANPISFVQRRRAFNGNVPVSKYRPGIAVVPEKMLKNIDFDTMGKMTVVRDMDTGRTAACGVTCLVTAEHSSVFHSKNVQVAKKQAHKQKENKLAPELRVGGENINGAARTVKFENGTNLLELQNLFTSTKDAKLKPIIAEMTKLRTLSDKMSKEGYQPTDMEVNVLTGYMQSAKNECIKFMNSLGKTNFLELKNPAETFNLVTKISNSIDPMITRVRDAQERDLLAFNVDMAKQAEDIAAERNALVGDNYQDPKIEQVTHKAVTSYDSNLIQYNYALKNIKSASKKGDMKIADRFLNSLQEIETITSELYASDKPVIGDISKLRLAYEKALLDAQDLTIKTGKTPAEKQILNLAKTISTSLAQDKAIIDSLKPGDQRNFSVQYMDAIIKGKDIKTITSDAKNSMLDYAIKLGDIAASRKKSSPEFKAMADATLQLLRSEDFIKDSKTLEKTCIDYIIKHKGVAKNDLEQSCMDIAYGLRSACHKQRTGLDIAQQIEAKKAEMQVNAPKKEEPQINSLQI